MPHRPDKPGVMRVAVALSLVGMAAVMATPSVAAPAARPSAQLSFVQNQVTAKHAAVFTYSTHHVPGSAKVTLQRPFGTRHVWRNVLTLGRSGTASAPGVPIGKYRYRIHIARGSRTLANSPIQALYAYGNVSLASICLRNQNQGQVEVNDVANFPCGPTDTVQVGDSVFTYLVRVGSPATYPNYNEIVKANDSTCSSITVEWGIDNGNPSDSTARVRIIRADADPQSQTIGYGTIGSLTAGLDRHAWALDFSSSDEHGDADTIYLNASLRCYTRAGA